MTSQIQCENIFLRHNENLAIENLNFQVDPGDFLIICGANGCGKTTLLRAILGLHPISSGNLRIHPSLKGEIGYLPQQIVEFHYFPASVEEVIMSGNIFSAFPFFREGHREAAEDAMEKLSVKDIRKKNFSALSGGQQKRVIFARALCAGKKMLILDEPEGALDGESLEKIHEILQELNAAGTTIIVVTHDFSAFAHEGKKILSLGKNIFFGTFEEFAMVKYD